jgi:hypothetical protein
MTTSWNDFIDGLADEALPAASKRTKEERFECGQCGGTGIYRGPRVHQEKAHCFACRGKGYFKTDPRKLKERRVNAAVAKAKALSDGIEAFRAAQPEMFRELKNVHELGGSNEFIVSLASQLFTRGSLSDKQVAAWHRGKEKLEAIRAERAAEAKKAEVSVDLAPIREMFETAVENGYKKPTYRAEGLIINRAPDTGNNPGALYVKNEEQTYLGKILGTTFKPVRGGESAAEALLAIAADPLAAALRYGQRTGRCACCGRELTNHASIDAGIGPICKDKWGL